MATNESPALIGIFDDRNEAELAADELREAGFREEHIGFAIRGGDAVEGGMITDAEGTKDAKGAITGAAAGAAIGAGFGALASLLIPGVGPVLAAGILATALGYGAAGAAIGGESWAARRRRRCDLSPAWRVRYPQRSVQPHPDDRAEQPVGTRLIRTSRRITKNTKKE
jgi:hypothetical protein